MVRACLAVDLCHASSAKAIDQLCWDLYNLTYATNKDIDQDHFQPELDVPVQVVGERSNDMSGALQAAMRQRYARRLEANAPVLDPERAVPRINLYSRYELAILLGRRCPGAAADPRRERLLICVQKLQRDFPNAVLAAESVPRFVLETQQRDRMKAAKLRQRARQIEQRWEDIATAFPQLREDRDAFEGFMRHCSVQDIARGLGSSSEDANPLSPLSASHRAFLQMPTLALAELLQADIVAGGGDASGDVLLWTSTEAALAAFEATGLADLRDLCEPPRFSCSELVEAMGRLLRDGSTVRTSSDGKLSRLRAVRAITSESIHFHESRCELDRLHELHLLQSWCMQEDLKVSTESEDPCDRPAEAHVFLRDRESTPGFLGCWLLVYMITLGKAVVTKLARARALEPPLGVAYWGMTQITIPASVGRLPLDVAARVLLTLLGASNRLLSCALCKQSVFIDPRLVLSPRQCARFSLNDGCGTLADVAGVIALCGCPHVYHNACIRAMRAMKKKRLGASPEDARSVEGSQEAGEVEEAASNAAWTCHLCSTG